MTCCSGGGPAARDVLTPTGAPLSGRRSMRRRVTAFAQWAVPIAALAMIPKCPACLAGYVLLFSGIGLSIPAATAARWCLIAACIVAIGWLAVRAGRRALTRLTCACAGRPECSARPMCSGAR